MPSRITRMRAFFAPPVFPDDEDKTRTARVLNTILLSMMLFLLFTGVFLVPFIFVEKLYNGLVTLIFLLALAAARWLMQQGHVRLTSVMLVSAIWIIFTAFLPFAGGMTSIVAVFYVTGTAIAGLLLGTRAAWINTLACILAGLVMVILESGDHPPLRIFPVPALAGWVDLTLSLLLTTAVLNLVLRSLNDALALARRQAEERRRTEEAQRREHDLLDRIAATSPAGITVVNRQGVITFANAQAESVLGLTRNKITQRTYNAPEWRITDYDGAPFPDEQLPFRQVMDSGQLVRDVRHAIEWPDGRRVLLSINAAPLLDETGETDGIVATIEDVTEQAQAEKALQESRARLQSIFRAAPVGIGLVSSRRLLQVNDRICEMLGRTRDELVGESTRVLYASDEDYEGVGREKYAQIRERGSGTVETHWQRKDGEILDILLSSTPLDAADLSAGVTFAALDITARKRAEEAIQLSEVRFRSLIEQTTDAVFCYEYDPPIRTDLSLEEQVKRFYQGVLVECNDVCARAYGATHAEEVTGRKLTDLFGTVPSSLDKFFRTFIRNGYRVVDEEGIEVLEDGTRRYFLNNGHGVVENGAHVRVWGTFRDITDRKRAEEEKRRHAQQLEALRQVGLEIAAELNLADLLHSIASRAIELLDGKAGGLYLCRPEQEELEWVVAVGPSLVPLGTVLRRGEGLSGQIWERGEPLTVSDYQAWSGRAEGYERYPFESVVGVPVHWGEEFLGVLNVQADAPRTFSPADTELLTLFAAQAAIAIKNATLYQDLQRRMVELQQAQSQLIQSAKMAAIGELAAGVAHELNNPLTSVLGFAELLLGDQDQDDLTRENLSIVVHEAYRARDIVRNLLSFSRQTESSQVNADINEALRETLNLLRRQLRLNHVELEEDYARNLPILRLATGRLKQVFLNLITNALYAMPRGGTLTVSSRRVGDEVAVRFVDSGVGIPAERLARIFEPFFTTKPVGQGTGLGLSVSLGIVQEHGGRITVESQVDEGSTFTVWLPVDRTMTVQNSR